MSFFAQGTDFEGVVGDVFNGNIAFDAGDADDFEVRIGQKSDQCDRIIAADITVKYDLVVCHCLYLDFSITDY